MVSCSCEQELNQSQYVGAKASEAAESASARI